MKTDLFNYLVTYYNVHPITYKRMRTMSVVTAYDVEHAKRIVDRHPSLILKVELLTKQKQNIK